MKRAGLTTLNIVGNVKRVLQWGNLSLILTEEVKDSMVITQDYQVDGETITYSRTYYYTDPHLYKVVHSADGSSSTIEDITACLTDNSKEDFQVRNDAQAGYFQGLSDIAITNDGYVVGCNYIRTYHHKHYVGETNFGDIDKDWDGNRISLYGSPDSQRPPMTTNGVQRTWDRPFFRVYMWKKPIWEMSASTHPTLIMQERIIGEIDPAWPKKGNAYLDDHICWVTADFERADIGYTLDVTGNRDNFALTYSATRPPYPQTFRRNDGSTFTETCYEDKVRFTTIYIADGDEYPKDGHVYTWLTKPTSIYVTKTAQTLHDEWGLPEVGKRFEIMSSPMSNKHWTFDGIKMGLRHFKQTSTKAYKGGNVGIDVAGTKGNVGLMEDYTYTQEGDVALDGHFGYAPYRNTYFRYGGRTLMVAPYTVRTNDGDIKVKGPRLYDITDGFNNMRLISLTGKEIDFNTLRDINQYPDVQVVENVQGTDLTLYLFIGKELLTLTSHDIEQARHTFAYDLRTTYDEHTNKSTFTYKVNNVPYQADLIFYAQDASNKKVEVGRHTIYQAGDNTLNMENGEIVGSYVLDCSKFITAGHTVSSNTERLLWSIEVQDTTVYNWQFLGESTAQHNGVKSNYSYNTIDKSPESPYFGRIYRVDDFSGRNTSRTGVVIHNPRFLTDNVVYNGVGLERPMRPAVDASGLLYVPDLPKHNDYGSTVRSTHAGVYVMNPAKNMAGKSFFDGEQVNGYWKVRKGHANSETMVGEVTGLAIRGTGNSTELIAYSRETKSYWNGSAGYRARFFNIGNTNLGTEPLWNKIPTRSIEIQNHANGSHDANIIPNANSIFVALAGGIGDGSDGYHCNGLTHPSLQEYENNGTLNYRSDNGTHLDHINRSPGAGAMLTNDGKYLLFQNTYEASSSLGNGRHSEFIMYALNNGSDDARLEVKYRYVYSFESVGNYTARSNSGVRQMNFDYAGNLVVSGADGWMALYAVPSVGVSSNTPILPDGNAANAAYYNIHETPAQSVLDCPYCIDGYDRIFTGEEDANWSNANNWEPSSLPTAMHRVRIDRDCAVNTTTATAAYIDLLNNASLTIHPAQGLTVGGSGVNEAASGDIVKEGYIRRVPTKQQTNVLNPNQRSDRQALKTGDLVIKSTSIGQGSLAQRDKDSMTLATVEIYGRYLYEDKDNAAYPLTWQYMGMPFRIPAAIDNFANMWMYSWKESSSLWDNIKGPDPLETWRGYIMTGRLSDGHRTFTLEGKLEKTNVTHEIPLSYAGTTTSYKGANYLANTWTAPLQIDNLTADDFVNADPTIYFYAPAADKRQYIAVPIGQAEAIGIETINALQGFFVLAKGVNAKLRLDYNTLVSKTEQAFWNDDVVNNQATTLLAPRRKANAVDTDNPSMMRIIIEGNDGSSDEIILFEHEDYTLGFDATFEGRKLEGAEGTPYFTAVSLDGDMSVLATPLFEGTMIHFRKGAATEYTLSFDYDSDGLYLQDLYTNMCVAIHSNNTYSFTTTEDMLRTRFRIIGQSSPEAIEPMAWSSNGKLYIENPCNTIMGVSVYTIDGKLVQQFSTHNTLFEVSVPNAGVYVVNLETENGSHAFKQIL